MPTLTPTPNPTASYVALSLSWPGVATATVSRVASDGSTLPVRNGEPATVISGVWSGQDYESPLDQPVYYTATSTDAPGTTVTSPSTTLTSNGAYWLKHPARPSLNQIVFPAEGHVAARAREIAQGVFHVLGRADPVVISTIRYDPATTLILGTATDADRQAMDALLASGDTLLFQSPGGTPFDGDQSGYVAVAQTSETRVGYGLPNRVWTLPITYTARPYGLAQAGAGDAWSDVIGDYTAWSDVIAAKATWQDLVDSVAP